MRNNEFNSYNEFNKFEENKSFEILPKNVKDKEVSSPKAEVYKSNEFSHFTSDKKKKTKDDNVIKKVIQKVTESASSFVGSVAATAAVVVTSVVVFTNLIIQQPTIELLNLEEGYDSVAYNISAYDLALDVQYYIVVSNSFEKYSFELVEGENINKIEDLSHGSFYELSVLGVNDKNKTESKYLSVNFFTIVNEKNVYEITWIVDGEIVKTDEVESGSIPVYTEDTPTKESTIDYDYIFTGWDKEIVEATEDVSYVAQFEEISREYNATYNLVTADLAVIYWDDPENNIVELDLGFDNSINERFSYRVILTDNVNGKEFIYEGTDAIARIVVPKEISTLYITYELIEIFDGQEKVYDEVEMENPIIFNNPEIIFSDLTLVGIDEYQLAFDINSTMEDEVYNNMELNLTFSDNSTKVINVNELLTNNGNAITINVPSGVSSIDIDYAINLLGNNGNKERVINGNKRYQLVNEYYLGRKIVDKEVYQVVKFEFIYHFIDEQTTIAVMDMSNSNVVLMDLYYSNFIEVPIDDSLTINEYQYYMAKNDGTKMEDPKSVNIDLTSKDGVYEFNYINPGDAVVTYNDDGTINIYLDTTFSSEDTSIYYSVVYTNQEQIKEVFYQESIASYENVLLSNYYIEYFVYKKVDDVEYIISSITPSGGIEFVENLTLTGYLTTTDSINYTMTVIFDYYIYSFDETSFVVTIDGIDYQIDSSNIIYNSDSYTYEVSYTVDFEPTTVSMRFKGTCYPNENEEIDPNKIKGDMYTTIIVEF